MNRFDVLRPLESVHDTEVLQYLTIAWTITIAASKFLATAARRPNFTESEANEKAKIRCCCG